MLSVVRTEERQRARELRAQGWSVKQIERHLGVARSSVSVWVRGVPLGEDQRRRLAARITEGRLQAAERKAANARRVRAGYQNQGRRLVDERNDSYIAGCMLYWAEGAKSRNVVKISNSDPEVLRFSRTS